MFTKSVMLSNHLVLCHPLLCLQSFPASESFPVSQLFASGGQNIGALALATVLTMNIQGWFPLGLTGLISLQSKGVFSRVFSNTKFQCINSLTFNILYGYFILGFTFNVVQTIDLEKIVMTYIQHYGASLVAQTLNNMPAMQETQVQSLGWEYLLKKETASHSSILAWRIPWTEEPGRLQSMESQRVGHDWTTNTSGSVVKNLPANTGDSSSIPGLLGSLDKELTTHSSIPPWEIMWTEDPGGLHSMRSQKRQDLVTKQQQQPSL